MNKIQELVLKAKIEKLDDEAKLYPIIFSTHESPIIEVKLNLDNTLFFSAGRDKRICIYNALNFTKLGIIKCNNATQKLLITNDSDLIFSIPLMGEIEIFKVINGQKKINFGDKDVRNLNAIFDYGNQRFFMLIKENRNCYIIIYDYYKFLSCLENNNMNIKKSIILKEKVQDQSKGLDVNLDGSIFYISAVSTVYKYNDEGKLLESNKLDCTAINKINLTKKYEFLLVASNIGVYMLNPDNLEVFNKFSTDWPILSTNISPLLYSKENKKYHIALAGGVESKLIANTTKGGLELLVYNFLDNKLIMNLKGFFGPINHLEFFKDGGGLITGGEEGILRIYRFDKQYFLNEQFN